MAHVAAAVASNPTGFANAGIAVGTFAQSTVAKIAQAIIIIICVILIIVGFSIVTGNFGSRGGWITLILGLAGLGGTIYWIHTSNTGPYFAPDGSSGTPPMMPMTRPPMQPGYGAMMPMARPPMQPGYGAMLPGRAGMTMRRYGMGEDDETVCPLGTLGADEDNIDAPQADDDLDELAGESFEEEEEVEDMNVVPSEPEKKKKKKKVKFT